MTDPGQKDPGQADPDLVDSAGSRILSNDDLWYTITLADGRELGLGAKDGPSTNGRTFVKPVPAGSGLTFRYQRTDGGAQPNHGWPQGEKGWLRGLQPQLDGSEVKLNLSLSAHVVPRLCLYNDNTNYGLRTQQLPGNKVALYGYNGNGKLVGIRLSPDDEYFFSHNSEHAVPLVVSFVRTGSVYKGFF